MVDATSLPTDIIAGQSGHIAWGNTVSDAVNDLTRIASLEFNVRDYGATGNGTTDDRVAIVAAMTAATAAGPARMVYLPPGVYRVDGGLSMSGQTCQLRGAGGTMTGLLGAAVGSGTTIKGTNQTGPVIDFVGYVWPVDHRGHLSFGNFTVEGDNVSDATKAHSGIRIGNSSGVNSAGGATWHDIVIGRTGGPCLELEMVYLCEFDRIVCVTPVNAQTNDVPYLLAKNVNACTFDRLGLRSVTSTNDCGVTGAVVITDNGTWDSYGTTFNDMWFEFLHPPTGGCLIKSQANYCVINDPSYSDCKPIAGSTNVAWVRYEPSGVLDQGGNIYRGLVPGAFPAATDNYPTYGIVTSQQRNRIEGVKGLKGTNVRLLSGSDGTYVHLGGAQTSTTTDAAFVNDSGVNNHTLIDEFMGLAYRGPALHRWQTSSTRKGLRIDDIATATTGSLYLGGTSAAVTGIAGELNLVGSQIILGNPSDLSLPQGLRMGPNGPKVTFFAGTPEGNVTAPVGSICLRTSGGGAGTCFYVKESGTGNTGWVAK